MKTTQFQTVLVCSALAFVCVVSFGFGRLDAQQAEDNFAAEARHIVGPRECAECHELENSTWLETKHHEGFKTLARRPEARALTEALGIRRLKTDDRCIRCHFTEQVDDSAQAKVIDGVSCESCHGAGAGWLEVHGDFGGDGLTRETEDAAHREGRLRACIDSGMRGPANLYDLAVRCYDCHLLDDAELHAAGHGLGSGFELSESMLGEVRHNFVRGKGQNAEASPERRRMLFLLGCLLEAQVTLRALAQLDAESTLLPAMAMRAEAARGQLLRITEHVTWQELDELKASLRSDGQLHPGTPNLLDMAVLVESVARQLAQGATTPNLEALEELLGTGGSER